MLEGYHLHLTCARNHRPVGQRGGASYSARLGHPKDGGKELHHTWVASHALSIAPTLLKDQSCIQPGVRPLPSSQVSLQPSTALWRGLRICPAPPSAVRRTVSPRAG